MAQISVAELLYDPDFVDPCTVLRQIETVGNDGMAVMAVQSIPILASIQAASGDELDMQAELARTGGSYEVITTFPLQCATDATAADVVLWGNVQFTVISIGRFGNFSPAAGHYEGLMTIKTIPVPLGLTVWDDGQTTWDDGATIWDVTVR